jgi:integrase
VSQAALRIHSGPCRRVRKGSAEIGAVMRLSEKVLAGLKLESGRKDCLVFDAACPGLGVRLTAKGTRTFVAQWTDPATRRKVREPLGVWGNLTLENARDAARARLGAVAKGIDVTAERRDRKATDQAKRAEEALTFDKLVEEWAALHLTHRRPRYAVEAERAIRYSLAELMKRPAARITRAEAVNALDKLAQNGKAAMTGRVMAYARAAFRWAQKRGKVETNPFADLPVSASTTERDRVLTDAELAAIWQATDGLGALFAPLVKVLILTLQRREEVAGMRWSELSADLSRWTIPAARMKNRKPHDVALPEAARAVLRDLPRLEGSVFVFTTTGRTAVSGFSKAKARLDALSGVSEWRLHDLRRTGVSKLAALGFDSIVADKLLAHQPAKLRGVAAVYQRHDFAAERARALDAWAVHVTGPDVGSNVVILRAGG